jgi:hypothetical protein
MATARSVHAAFDRWFEPKTGRDIVERARVPWERYHGDGVVYKRGHFEWVLAADLGPHIRYDRRLLPVVVLDVLITPGHVHIWARGLNRRVFAWGRPNEDYYLHVAARRILRGYRGGTTLERTPLL